MDSDLAMTTVGRAPIANVGTFWFLSRINLVAEKLAHCFWGGAA
jgi:hypothetical protein